MNQQVNTPVANQSAIVLDFMSKGDDIRKILGEQLKTGEVIVAAVNTTTNPDYMRAMFVQQVERPSSATPTLEAMSLGWDNVSIKRKYQNFHIDTFTKGEVKPGATAREIYSKLAGQDVGSVNIEITEDHTPERGPNYVQSPLVNPTSGKVLTSNQQPIFEHTTLVVGDASHTLLTRDAATPVAPQPNDNQAF